MIRFSEMVLRGHPDKFCDQVADAIVARCLEHDPEAYAQVEAAVWCDDLWINGGIATTTPIDLNIEEIVSNVIQAVGYKSRPNSPQEREEPRRTRGTAPPPEEPRNRGTEELPSVPLPRRYQIHDALCRDATDPRRWSRHVNDQAIVVGWAGYDERTAYLPPEHWLAHQFREALERSIHPSWGAGVPPAVPGRPGRGRRNDLAGEGPDGKLLLRINEDAQGWRLEHLLVTLQQRETTEFLDLMQRLESVLEHAWRTVQRADARWKGAWSDTELLLNPNGPLVGGGSDGDNGQTGRKLVMDYYGPRVAIGGGALAGKHPTHIDRLGAIALRDAAIQAVKSGAKECRITAAWAPNESEPLEVVYEMEGRGLRFDKEWFRHEAMRERYAARGIDAADARGATFLRID